jgi:hypothetical protein
MSETQVSDEALGRALASLGRDVAFPPTPATASEVVERLRAGRAARSRPPFPALALWSRRRVLALVAVGILAVLALAFAARLVLGAAEIRVQPGVTPSGPPLGPAGLGTPVPVGELEDAVGFEVRLPLGPLPDEAYVFTAGSGNGAALLAWDAGERYPHLPGTPWGLILMQVEGEETALAKNVGDAEDARAVEVGGRRSIWIDAPHELLVITDEGAQRFLVEGNVLIWVDAGITYRLETTLALPAAIALAESLT